MDLYLLAGQSNMSSRGRTMPGDNVERESRIFALDVECNWDEAWGGVYTYQNFPDRCIFDFKDKIGLGPGLRFAECLLEAGCERDIGLIPTAVGGTSLREWDPEKGKCYTQAVSRARTAQKHGTLRALLWHQGESDANEKDFSMYGDKLKAVFSGFRRDLNEPELVILVGTLGEWLEGHFDAKRMFSRWRDINKQIRDVVSSTPGVYLVDSTGLSHAGDNLHFSSEGAQRLGERYCNVFFSISEETKVPQTLSKPSEFGRSIMRNQESRTEKIGSIISEIEKAMFGFSNKKRQIIALTQQM